MNNNFMGSREVIKEELIRLLNAYYNGSFVQLVRDYIRFTGMTRQEVERILEELRRANGV